MRSPRRLNWLCPATLFASSGGQAAMREGEGYHRPVLVDEVVAALAPAKGCIFFDGTAGGGGHSAVLLERGADVVACDRDGAALAHAGERLAGFGGRFQVHRGSFADMRGFLDRSGIDRVDGVLLDLGVSSRQLDEGERGFSFQHDGPLDMRMDTRGGRTAADLVAEESEDTLRTIFRDYGEERSARRVAAEIVKSRSLRPIETTRQLADVVESVLPRRSGRHPATRVFQALRIAVNDELGELERGLEASLHCLKPGGRLAVISFHSLEDRIVKRFLRDRSRPTVDRPEWPAPRPNPDWFFEPRLPKSQAPSGAEIASNPRARSARLRVAVRCAESPAE